MPECRITAVLTGDGIELRPFSAADVNEGYCRWLNDAETMRFIESRRVRHDLDSVRAYIEASTRNPSVSFFRIVADGHGHVGNIRLTAVPIHRRASVGIMIGRKDLWGKGIAAKAIALLTEAAFSKLDLVKLTAGAYSLNEGSIRAFLKAGWHVEATMRRHFVDQGKPVDGVFLAAFPGAR